AAVLAMNLFPTAYVLVAPYTEAPFLAFTVWSVLAARAGRWPRAGIFAALAAATRIQGAFLIPALAAVYLASGLRLERRAAWLLAPCLSLLAYLGINAWVFGNPLFFLQVQEQVFHVETQVPWLTVQDLVRAVTSNSVDSFWATVYLAPLAAIVLVLAVAAWTITRARSRPDDAIVACLNAISLAALSWPISVPRYLVGVYPIDLALARIIRMRSVGLVLGAGSTLLLGLYTLQFTLGRWAF
ncbi:MAG TPA: hypothetical protein VIV06_00690, partial [Candidatus Limnocylindrales bacterium]